MSNKLEFWKIDGETYLLKSHVHRGTFLKTETSTVDIELYNNSTYPKPIRVYRKSSRNLGYRQAVNGVEITNDQHIQNMKPFFVLADEGEKEWLYPGAKIDYNDYMSSYSHTPINEEYEEEIEFEIIEVANLTLEELKYVTPLWHYTNQSRGNCKLVEFNMNRYAKDKFQSEANRYEIGHLISNSDHSCLEYAKINGKYVGHKDLDLTTATFTVDQYRIKRSWIDSEIDKIFRKFHAENINVNKETVASMIDFITSISSRVYDLEVKSKSSGMKSHLLKMMNDKKNELFKLIKLPGETE